MNLFLSLALILLTAKLCATGARYFKAPAIAGELFAGILLGPSLLNLLHPNSSLQLIAEVAVILLLFEVGMDSQFEVLKKVGRTAFGVATVGFILPFVLVLSLNFLVFKLSYLQALFIAGALTATSIGVTVRVLSDLKRRHQYEANIVIAAAIFDDIFGVLLLTLLLGLAGSKNGSLSALMETGFILVAFAVGLILSRYKYFMQSCAKPSHACIGVITPIFFVMIGTSINLQAILWDSSLIWILFGGLFIIAFIGKFLAGFVVKTSRKIQTIVGLSMLPRGEVGLVFAQLGLQSQVLNVEEYTALILVVIATTFLAPFLLRWRYADLPNTL